MSRVNSDGSIKVVDHELGVVLQVLIARTVPSTPRLYWVFWNGTILDIDVNTAAGIQGPKLANQNLPAARLARSRTANRELAPLLTGGTGTVQPAR